MFLGDTRRLKNLLLMTGLVLSGCDDSFFQNRDSKTAQPSFEQKSAQIIETLTWNEFFKMPIGPLGLEPTEKLLHLHNKIVRITGFMVKEEEPIAGLFMLAGVPVSMSEQEDGPADDLPPATIFVHLPESDHDKRLKYRPGPLELIGVLTLGNQEEANGRVSYVQLKLN